MALPRAATEHYRRQQRALAALLVASDRVWAGLDSRDLDGSWLPVQATLLGVLVAAQQSTVTDADTYVRAVLGELDIADDPEGSLNVSGFLGTASDGRELGPLLAQSVLASKGATARGLAPAAGKAVGGRLLRRIMATQFSDATRAAESVGIAQRRNVTGYVRMLNLPSCGRCVILAGRWYRWSTGFARHDLCDCKHIPAREDMAGDLRTDPQAAVAAGMVRGLTKAETSAIGDGADLNQVVNARRGMQTAQVYGQQVRVTPEGDTVRGIYGSSRSDLERVAGRRYRSTKTPRLTPESIYRVAEDRADAVRLLRLYRYIV